MSEWLMDHFGWMYWTVPSGLFFIGLFLTITGMGIWDMYSPSISRKGFLPIPTSRGERLFIGIISTICIFLLWMAFWGCTFLWGALIISIIWFVIEARWG